MTEAKRTNSGKPKMSYMPLWLMKGAMGWYCALAQCDCVPLMKLQPLVEVFEQGAEKYSRGNWLQGFPVEKTMDSLCRHLFKFCGGEEFDDESGKPHLAHVLWNLISLKLRSTKDNGEPLCFLKSPNTRDMLELLLDSVGRLSESVAGEKPFVNDTDVDFAIGVCMLLMIKIDYTGGGLFHDTTN